MNNISLQYFITAAEEQNITQAAAKLFISQQALSGHIKKLEKAYNAVFFERSPKLKLTYQGERMLAYARRVVEAEHDLVEKLRDDSENRRIRMTIGQTSTRGTVFMPTIIGNYYKMFPNVVLSIISGNHDYIENQLQLGKIELYMGMSANTNLRSSGKTLYRDRLYFIISRELLSQVLGAGANGFVDTHLHGCDLTDACRFPMALPPTTSTLRTTFETMFNERSLSPNIVLETTEHDILFDVCKNGLCGCFVSRELLYRKIMHKSRPSNVLYFPAEGITELAHFNIVYGNREPSLHVRSFIDCCRETIWRSIEEIDKYLVSESTVNSHVSPKMFAF